MKNRKLIADLTREKYLEFLEDDYQTRMQEEYGNELGYFGNAAIDARNKKGGVALDLEEHYLGVGMKEVREDQSILKEIEEEIKQITEGAKNDESMMKNMKQIGGRDA